MTDNAAIRTEGLTKHFGDVKAIEEVSLEVNQGDVFGFLGPNGAGKTTFIRTILGFLKPTRGDAYLLDRDVSSRDELLEAKDKVGYIPGSPTFYESHTGHEHIEYFQGLRSDENLDELIEIFEPPLGKKVGEYSTGNKQKLAIVLALMHDPELVLMDEPTSGLDPLMQERFYDYLDRDKAEPLTVFLSSHILSEVRRICQRVGIIRSGRLVDVVDMDELISRGGRVVRLKPKESIDREDLILEGVSSIEEVDGYFEAIIEGDIDSLLEDLQRYSLEDLEIRKASLEDLFMHYYSTGEEAEPYV